MLPIWFWDLMTAAIILICVILSYRNGFLRSFVAFIGAAAAFVAAILVSEPIASAAYDILLDDRITSVVESAVEEHGVDGVESILETADALIAMLPASLQGVIDAETAEELIGEKYIDLVNENAKDISLVISQKIIAPIITGTIQIFVFCLVFIVGTMLMKLLARLLGGVKYVPLFGSLDRVLGGLFGAIQGMLYVFLAAALIWVLIQITDDTLPFVTRSAADSTLLFGRFLAVVSDIANPL